MLPSPYTISETSTTQETSDNRKPPAQHGSSTVVATGQLPTKADRGNDAYVARGEDNHDESLVSSSEEWDSRAGRLNETTAPAVSDNEGLISTYNVPVLQLTQTNIYTKPGPRHVSDLPNEILVHVLSHLSPSDLAAVALVSRRYHQLVTSPHAWRSAFARYFPGSHSIDRNKADDNIEPQAIVRSEKRAFTRLTQRATWRSEYILRTRLLRSLARGKPVQLATGSAAAPANRSRNVSPEITYSSELFGSINHLHATWITGLNKRSVRIIHGADDIGTSTISDPTIGKVDRWGLSDPQLLLQFSDQFPGDAQYGLGPGNIIGSPNVMDVSQVYGMAYGEGFPGGMAYYRSIDEMRGRYLFSSSTVSAPSDGVPRLLASESSITSIWVAKSAAIPSLTDGLIGLLCGGSNGVVTAYSLGSPGPSSNRSARFARGEITARWTLSPGIPVIAICVDNEYTMKRQAQNRIWAMALNALGECFYLTKFPRRSRSSLINGEEEVTAWHTGRSVFWNLIEPSRRSARPDPYNQESVNGSYSPRSSWNGMCLSKAQIEAETKEIQTFLAMKPKDFQRLCHGWDMRRKLVVDFAGDDDHHAGEAVVVIECGLDEGATAKVQRFQRLRLQDKAGPSFASTPPMTVASTPPSSSPSIFGGSRSPVLSQPAPLSIDSLEHSLGGQEIAEATTPRPLYEDWFTSVFSFGGLKKVRVLATTIDYSTHAVQTHSEDPLLNLADVSVTSSPSLGPWAANESIADSTDIPGQRARLFALGTQIGCVVMWNIREPTSGSSDIVNTVEPIRIIFTDSPQISSLALTSLHLVHGGSDGLVQAWDVLASDNRPIRTLHSRFSSRARRQLVQAQASPQGVGTNMYAAAAICLDPDPTSLRGVVALGNRLRYWAYSSSAADRYKSSKRKLRRSERGSNNTGERFTGTARTNLKDYIASERFELDREKHQRQREADHLAGRFGTDLMDGSEQEMMAYAAMLSQESLAQETARRSSDTASATASSAFGVGESNVWSSDATQTPPGSTRLEPVSLKTDDELDADVAEAIRQSLMTSPSSSAYDVPIRVGKSKQRKGSSTRPSPRPSPPLAGSSKHSGTSDLEFAIQLSIAEEASKAEHGNS